MCWVGKLTDRKVAIENVTVYKILAMDNYGNYFSPFIGSYYSIGEKYVLNSITPKQDYVGVNVSVTCKIYEGMHSFNGNCMVEYDTIKRALVFKEDGIMLCSIEIFNNNPILLHTFVVIAKCTIPKGSVYYENKDGEIVSDGLIINEIYRHIPEKKKHFYEIK